MNGNPLNIWGLDEISNLHFDSHTYYSLYFHIPFCTKKCHYCHFYVIPDKEEYKAKYMQALYLEWELRKSLFLNKDLVSVYFGGGTPALLGPTHIEKILGWISPSPEIEITLEVNPDNVTAHLMKAYFQSGVNRISLGVQSLVDSELQMLGRTHGSKQALKAIEIVFNAGFKNISIDLMYDLPYQTPNLWEKTLSYVQTLPITHLSLYNLTIEPHTVFFKKRETLLPTIPPDEISMQLLQEAIDTLQTSGFKRYEISAFCKENYLSRHNSGYWTARPFIGFGPSAFSYWDKKRFRNKANLNHYDKLLKIGADPLDFEEKLSSEERMKELLAIRLRLLHPFNLKHLEKDISDGTKQTLMKLTKEGFIDFDGKTLHLTKKGTFFYDSVAEAII